MLKIKDILTIGVAVLLAGCSSDDIMTGEGLEVSSISDEWDIKPGDPVAFTLLPSVKAQTRVKEKDDSFDSYAAIENGYELTIEMFGTGEVSKGSAVYSVTDGALVPETSGSQLYWPDNTQQYGFKATAGTTTLEADQSDATKLRNQDRLEGYAFVPLKNGEDLLYDKNNLNYMTSKEWKAANVTFGEIGDNQKKIPLYLKHKRSKITIILKAGANVARSTLATASNITMKIYSYQGSTTTEITPCASSTTVDYTASDYGGAAASVATTKYQAIVDPYDYRTGEGKNIAQITVGGRTFTYKPSNDTSGTGDYDLTAGKHLTITITLP